MKFPLLDAHPREHKIEVHGGGWMGLRKKKRVSRGDVAQRGFGDDYYTVVEKTTTPMRTTTSTSTRTAHKSF
ncbi:hypothetical protein Trydic_g16679 [Trypoxylus dichotomus]